jgi:hypothetical protein
MLEKICIHYDMFDRESRGEGRNSYYDIEESNSNLPIINQLRRITLISDHV